MPICLDAVAMATSHPDFVVGVVCRGHLSDAPGLVHMTPGNPSVQRTPSNPATLGTSQSALIRGVASFQGWWVCTIQWTLSNQALLGPVTCFTVHTLAG